MVSLFALIDHSEGSLNQFIFSSVCAFGAVEEISMKTNVMNRERDILMTESDVMIVLLKKIFC